MRFHRRPVAAAAAVLSLAAALAGCSAPSEPSGDRELVLGMGPGDLSNSGDPFAGSQLAVATWVPVYESLGSWDPAENVYGPWLATEYSLSDDRKTFSFTLRDDVDFTDGAHLVAADVAEYLNELLVSDGYSDVGISRPHEPVVTATGEYTFEVTTSIPISATFYEYLLRYIPIPSPAIMDDPESFAENPIGTGPYVLADREPEVSITFERNPNYWNPDVFDFDTVVYQAFEDGVAALNALVTGQIDATPLLALSQAEVAEQDGFTIHRNPGGYSAMYISDYEGVLVPALGDIRVRRAMNMAIDQAAITAAIDLGYGEESSQIFTEGQPEYVEGGDDRYPYDVDAAKELMADAGYADGFDLTIPRVAADFYPTDYEPILTQMLAEIGVRITYEDFGDVAAYVDTLLAPEPTFPVFLMKVYYNFMPSSLYNYFFPNFFKDPAYAEIRVAADTGDIDESAAAAAETGEYFLDQAWFVPISHADAIWTTVSDVDYQGSNLDPWFQLRSLTLVE